MRVMIQIQERVARELQNHFSHPADSPKIKPNTARLLHVINEFGAGLTPVHPGAVHPLLVPFFMVDVSDQATAEQMIRRVRRFKTVEAAYIQPESQLA